MVNNFRFIDEYANYKKKQAKKDCKLFCSFTNTKEKKDAYKRAYEYRLANIGGILKAVHQGMITLDECMGMLVKA